MNPSRWKREHRIAFAIAVVVGVIFGIITGYFAFAISRGASGAPGVKYWLQYFPLDVLGWAVIGGACGGLVVYARRLLS